MELALSLRGVSKYFGGLHALDNIDMDIAVGEHVAIIGPNGAGKTTLFNVATGELRESRGKIILFGKDVARKPKRKRAALGLSRTYQVTSIFETLTVEQNILLSLLGLNRGHFDMLRDSSNIISHSGRVKEVTEVVGLHDKTRIISGKLSHGEKRQLEIGLAIVNNPRLILLDEPTAGLSPVERDKIVKMLNLLFSNVTLLLIEHDISVAFSVAKRVLVLYEGRIIAEGSPEEIGSNSMVQEVYLGKKVDE